MRQTLNAALYRLEEGLKELNRRLKGNRPSWDDLRFANEVTKAAFDVLKTDGASNRLSDAEVEAAVPRVEGAAKLVEALLERI